MTTIKSVCLADGILHSFYFGRHLQPSVFDMDVKAFITNRVMCSIWACFLISAFACQRFRFFLTTEGFLCTALLQFIYIFRRLWSDNCSPNTLDNQIDRAGFYRLWGVLVFLPTLYLTPITLQATVSIQSTKKIFLISMCLDGFFSEQILLRICLRDWPILPACDQLD